MKAQIFLQVPLHLLLRSVAQEHSLGVLMVAFDRPPPQPGLSQVSVTSLLPAPETRTGCISFSFITSSSNSLPPGYSFLWRAKARRGGTSPLCIPHQDVPLIPAGRLCPAGLAGWSWGLCQPTSTAMLLRTAELCHHEQPAGKLAMENGNLI